MKRAITRDERKALRAKRVLLLRALRRLARDRVVSCNGKALGLLLWSYSNEDGQCWPSQNQMAEGIGSSVATVKRALSELKDHGYVTTAMRHRLTGRGGRTSDMIVWQTNLFPLLNLSGKGVDKSGGMSSPVSYNRGGYELKSEGVSAHGCTGDTMNYFTEETGHARRDERDGVDKGSTVAPSSGAPVTPIDPGAEWRERMAALRALRRAEA